jgi:ABC-2 type transport system ATP-binding protein
MRLAFRDVTAGYRRGLRRRTVVERLSIVLEAGQVTALVGANGAGKTTLLRLAAGTLRPWRGRVGPLTNGGGEPSRRGRRTRVGYLPDRVTLPRGQTLARFLRYGAFLAGYPHDLAEAAVASAAADACLSDELHSPLSSFSMGMARRAAVAFALLERPPVLLLDEPWQGLDPRSRHLLVRVLRNEADRGTLVVVSSHDLHDVVPLADRVLVLESGGVTADLHAPVEPAAVLARLAGVG